MYKKINTMTWDEVAALDSSKVVCVLPIASLEQHGQSLPLGTDDFILRSSLDEMARHIDVEHYFLELPQIHYGSSFEHLDFAGTIAISHSVLVSWIEEILQNLSRHHFTKLVVINSHGGNAPIFRGLSQEWEQKKGIRIFHIDYFGSDFFVDAQGLIDTPVANDVHGGEIEESILSYCMPEVVKSDKAIPENDVFTELKSYYDGWLSRNISPDNGLIGMASRGNSVKGQKLFEYVWKKLINYFIEFDHTFFC